MKALSHLIADQIDRELGAGYVGKTCLLAYHAESGIFFGTDANFGVEGVRIIGEITLRDGFGQRVGYRAIAKQIQKLIAQA